MTTHECASNNFIEADTAVKIKANAQLLKPNQPSDPSLLSIWQGLRQYWFPNRPELDCYQLRWSGRRQKHTLASCNLETYTVTVARELQPMKYQLWLGPLLYHELCHAALGRDVPKRNGRTAWHGTAFKTLETRHPLIPLLNTWIKQGGWQRAVKHAHTRHT